MCKSWWISSLFYNTTTRTMAGKTMRGEPMNSSFIMRCSETDKTKLHNHAKKRGISVSSLIRNTLIKDNLLDVFNEGVWLYDFNLGYKLHKEGLIKGANDSYLYWKRAITVVKAESISNERGMWRHIYCSVEKDEWWYPTTRRQTFN